MVRTRNRAVTAVAALLLSVGALSACEPTVPPPPGDMRTQTPGDVAAQAARSQIGQPYVYGGSSPSTGFDCSGLVMWSWQQAGTALPHSSSAQYSATTRITREQLQPGDLVFYGYYGQVGHVTMYVGGGRIVHAPSRRSDRPVEEVDLAMYWTTGLIGYGRVTPTPTTTTTTAPNPTTTTTPTATAG